MKTTKRLLAVVLAMVLLCVGVPFAFAEDATIVDSGTCGDNLTWAFDSEGMLTISGMGKMNDYSNSDGRTSAPWGEYCDILRTAMLQPGVTCIGDSAFFGCCLLTSVTIPDSVTSIGEQVFEYCSALKSVIIPNRVASIGYKGFAYCVSLGSVMLSESMNSIAIGLFESCTSLKNVTIPKRVKIINECAFANCISLTNISIPVNATSIGGNAFNDCRELKDIYYCGTPEDWAAVSIGENNESIQAASLHYHDPQIGAVVAPTCMEPGYTPFICTRCGETISKTDPTDALGHDMQPTYVWAKDDTTVTATMVCTRCDKTGMTETAKVTTEVTVKPTCSSEGELTMIAAFNNKSFYAQVKTKVLPPDPDAHVLKVTVTPPTCLDDGYTTHACTLCRYGYSDEIVAALGHDLQHHDAKAPTCMEPGWEAYDACSRCDYATYRELATVDHADADNDGKCDFCEKQMQGGSHCKFCGKVHDGNFFDKLTGFFHKIFAVFKR